jgi:DNL zinc finger
VFAMNCPLSLVIWFVSFVAVDGWVRPIETISRSLARENEYIHRHEGYLIHASGVGLKMNDVDDDDEDFENDSGSVSDSIRQLPPIGASESSTNPTGLINNDKPFVANHKFQIQYTCNICETRNTNTISRLAYRQGVVIARCKGCQNQHLIADHLGWTDYEGGFKGNETNTIEDYFANDANNKTNVTVSRVNTDVFELEKILQYNADKSGAIVSDNGKLALE